MVNCICDKSSYCFAHPKTKGKQGEPRVCACSHIKYHHINGTLECQDCDCKQYNGD